MRIAILAVGDELTCGYRLDTNSQAISQRLALLPADVVLHLTVGDDMEAIHRALDTVLSVADAVIVTGGLGPTEDDLTRQAVAAYFGLELVEDAEALARIQARFAHRGRAMPESNRIQARVPAGSTVIQNERGTAAGFYLIVGQQSPDPPLRGGLGGQPSPNPPLRGGLERHIFVTPGIPYEMEGMLEGFILPRLQALAGTGHHVRRAVLKVYGLPESEINERIRPLLARGRNPLLGLLPHRGTITVEVAASGRTPEEAERLLEADLVALRAELGPYVIGEGERELPQAVADLLMERGLTIATAELGTGGLVAARLTEPEGFERWFRRGVSFHSEREASGRGRNSRMSYEDDALIMATAIQKAAKADVGVGVGPIVVPEDSTPQRPYGVVHVAVNLQGQETCRRFSFNGDRATVREWAADAALALVRVWVLEQNGGMSR